MPVAARTPRKTKAATQKTPPSKAPRKPAAASASADVDTRCADAIAALKAHATEATRAGMARFAIPNDKALGVGMRDVQAVAKTIGRDHALAEALWQTDIYDARMLACYVDEPAAITPAQMDRWVRSIDNWAHCDTTCFVLFDRTPHAWKKIEQWATRREEFIKRAAFALLASVALHDKKADDTNFLRGLELVEAAADDARNFVKKGVNWALRAIGKRKSAPLRAATIATAKRLAASDQATPRWIGKDALRELNKHP